MTTTRKIVIGMDAGMAGTDGWEFYEVPASLTDNQLGEFAWECAVSHAEMYGIYPADHYTDEEIEEDPDAYSDNIEGWWEDYDPKKHDGHTIGGVPHWNEY